MCESWRRSTARSDIRRTSQVNKTFKWQLFKTDLHRKQLADWLRVHSQYPEVSDDFSHDICLWKWIFCACCIEIQTPKQTGCAVRRSKVGTSMASTRQMMISENCRTASGLSLNYSEQQTSKHKFRRLHKYYVLHRHVGYYCIQNVCTCYCN